MESIVKPAIRCPFHHRVIMVRLGEQQAPPVPNSLVNIWLHFVKGFHGEICTGILNYNHREISGQRKHLSQNVIKNPKSFSSSHLSVHYLSLGLPKQPHQEW